MNSRQAFAFGVPAPPPTAVPWETTRGFAKIGALFTTIWRVVSAADPFFTGLSPDGKGHFSFAWLLVLFTGYVQLLYETFFVALQRALLGSFAPESFAGFHPVSFLLAGGLLLPGFVALSILVEALLNHAVLLLIDRARAPFRATLRAKCYATAPVILCVIPLVGPLLAWVGCIITSILGLRRMHRTGAGAAIVAYFLPVVITFLFLIFLAFFFVFAGAMRGFANLTH